MQALDRMHQLSGAKRVVLVNSNTGGKSAGKESLEIYCHINELPKHHPDKLWINELEFTAIVVNNFAASAALVNHYIDFDWQPLLYCSGDNKSENCCSFKFSNSNKFSQ